MDKKVGKPLSDEWLYSISAKRKLFYFNFEETWRYRDLLFLFVKRDIVTLYKQTIFGPLWYLIQPLFTSIIFTIVFNNIANISAGDGVPSFLFNMAGITCWNYFKECITGTSDTFKQNQGIFGKVYFPRIIMPLKTVISNLLKFGIQLFIFGCFFLYFKFFHKETFDIAIQIEIVLLPILVFVMGLFGLGIGMIISSMTTKYRDLSFLVGFGVQLLMYVSAVMYPLELIKEKIELGSLPKIVGTLIEFNPMAHVIEGFRYLTLGVGFFSYVTFLYTLGVSFLVFIIGLLIFNKTEQSFIDTV